MPLITVRHFIYSQVYIYSFTQKLLLFHLHITIIHKRLNPILQKQKIKAL